jgi:hypothetical protein
MQEPASLEWTLVSVSRSHRRADDDIATVCDRRQKVCRCVLFRIAATEVRSSSPKLGAPATCARFGMRRHRYTEAHVENRDASDRRYLAKLIRRCRLDVQCDEAARQLNET